MVKHVGDITGVMLAPSDVACSTALHRLEFLFCGPCVWIPNAGGIIEGWPDYGFIGTSVD